MGDDQDRAGIGAQMPFEPRDGLGIEMVGRLVEEQQIGLFEQQPTHGHAAAFTAGKVLHAPIVRRAAQGVHGLIDLGIEIPQILGLDLVLERRHLVGGLLGIVHGEIIVALENTLELSHTELDILAHGLVVLEPGAPAAGSRPSPHRRPRPRRSIPCRARP